VASVQILADSRCRWLPSADGGSALLEELEEMLRSLLSCRTALAVFTLPRH
jgi:hypothetical protein